MNRWTWLGSERRALAVVVASVLVIGAVLAFRAYDGSSAVPPSRGPTQSPTAAVATATPPTATPTAVPKPTGTSGVAAVWLLDVRTDRVARLAETPGFVIHAGLDEAGTQILVVLSDGEDELIRFDLEGDRLATGPWPPRGIVGDYARCDQIRPMSAPGDAPPIVEIDGRRFENVSCGSISPDDRWMTYFLWAENASLETHPLNIDHWVVDLNTDERRLLQKDLVHCGGCDSVPSPQWSPSGRYVFFSDVVAGGDRFFLADIQAGTVRRLTEHDPREPFDIPAWSPKTDQLLSSDAAGATVLQDLGAGQEMVIAEVPWPARFDPTGTFVYGPAWHHEEAEDRTVLDDVGAATVRTVLAGQPPVRVFAGIGGPAITADAVIATPTGSVATLVEASGCTGLTIYSNERVTGCVDRAVRAVLSPDGSKVGVLRRLTDSAPAEGPSHWLFELVLLETGSGREIASSRSLRILSEPNARTVGMAWNPEGTHLVISGTAAPGSP